METVWSFEEDDAADSAVSVGLFNGFHFQQRAAINYAARQGTTHSNR
jgi:hypothetical protein